MSLGQVSSRRSTAGKCPSALTPLRSVHVTPLLASVALIRSARSGRIYAQEVRPQGLNNWTRSVGWPKFLRPGVEQYDSLCRASEIFELTTCKSGWINFFFYRCLILMSFGGRGITPTQIPSDSRWGALLGFPGTPVDTLDGEFEFNVDVNDQRMIT